MSRKAKGRNLRSRPAALRSLRVGTCLAEVLVDVVNGLLDGGDLLSLFVRDFRLEFFFECHHQLDRVQRVGAEIVDERSLIGDFFFLDAQLLDNDLLGLIAGSLTTIAFLPQVIKALRSGSTKDMSLTMWLLLCTGVGCWLVYGIMLRSYPIMITNAITLLLAGTVLVLKIRNG